MSRSAIAVVAPVKPSRPRSIAAVVPVCTDIVKGTELAPGGTVDGLKFNVAPAGSPVAVNAIGKENIPFTEAAVKSKVADLPGSTVWAAEPPGPDAIVKSSLS